MALGGNVGADAAKADKGAAFVMAGTGRQLPPACLAAHLDFEQQVRKRLAPLELVGQRVEGGGELPGLPAVAGENLEERPPLDRQRLLAQCISEARRHMGQAFGGIDLPQPVGIAFLMLAQQQADHLFLLDQREAGGGVHQECTPLGQRARQQHGGKAQIGDGQQVEAEGRKECRRSGSGHDQRAGSGQRHRGQ